MKRISAFFVLLIILIVSVACISNEVAKNEIVLPDDIPNFVEKGDFDKIDWGKKAVEFGDNGIIGNENKSGVIGANMPSLNGQKWMWHLWGENNVELTVVGFHKESKTVHKILADSWTTQAQHPNNGADAHSPSTVKIPEVGEWAILLYTEGKLFDTLIFEINE